MSAEKKIWNAEYVNQKLASLDLRKTQPRKEPPITGYHLAAAVLSSFNPEELKPVGEAGYGDFKELINDSTVLPARSSAAWTLIPAARQRSLRALANRGGLLAALGANDVQRDPLGHLLLGYFDGTVPDVERQSLDQLISTLQILDWLKDDEIKRSIPAEVTYRLPTEDRVRTRVELERLLKPFRDLVGDTFRGRVAELARLSDYVGFLQASSKLEAARRGVRDILSLAEEPPLLITGPGGVGKSTLIAKFILDHLDVATGRVGIRPQTDVELLSFAYLDLNRPDLRVEEPISLLVEIVKQLGIVFPQVGKRSEDLASSWTRGVLDDARFSSGSSPSAWQPLIGELSDLLDLLGSPRGLTEKPLLLVIDNFEDAQYRGRELVLQLWTFLNSLQGRIPRLRTVFAGRSEINEFATKVLRLSDFDLEASTAFLRVRGITESQEARQLVEQVGGNPLTLRLTAELVNREGIGALRDLNTRRLFFFKLSSALIQGQLYWRILDHIHDERVRRLAHPGLVVRRVSPEVILDVLSGPCDVPVDTKDDAQKLFDEFRREVSLVWESSDGSLHHRSDVRRIMLPRLVTDEPEKVRLIHENAIHFYQRQNDVISRAEEIYHRLALGQSDEATAARFTDGVDEYLRDAVQELPPRSQAFLASRIGIELDSSIWKEADLESWELQAASRAERLLSINSADAALSMLQQRQERSKTSPLYRLEALAYEQLADSDKSNRKRLLTKARSLIAEALARPADPDRSDYVRLDNLVAAARLDEKMGAPLSVENALEEFQVVAEHYAGDPRVVAMALHRIKLLQKELDSSRSVRQLFANVVRFLDSVSEERIAENPSIFFDFANQIVLFSPETVIRLVRRVGLRRMFSSTFRDQFLKTLRRTWREYPDYRRLATESIESLSGRTLPSPIEDAVVSVLREQQGLSGEPPILDPSLLEIRLDPKTIRTTSRNLMIVEIGAFGEGSITEAKSAQSDEGL